MDRIKSSFNAKKASTLISFRRKRRPSYPVIYNVVYLPSHHNINIPQVRTELCPYSTNKVLALPSPPRSSLKPRNIVSSQKMSPNMIICNISNKYNMKHLQTFISYLNNIFLNRNETDIIIIS